jgi:hypothetical protein
VLTTICLVFPTVLALAPRGAPLNAQASCSYVLGFETLVGLLGPEVVGDCLEDQRFNPANGNAEQRTAGGLLVWRPADNWTAFTDGHRTWVNGPEGLAVRLNGELFSWETPPSGASSPPTSAPPASAGDGTSLQFAEPDTAGEVSAAPASTGGSSGTSDQTAVPQVRSHDWRSPGFVAVAGGRLYDPRCVPLHSAGINVPNLPFRDGVEGTLEWMHRHRLRWMRVFATGHNLPAERAPRDAAAAVAALRSLLARVEAFNARHDPAEAIYVLVALTDYYPLGVPGDRFAYDHPVYRGSPVLPAPWYRTGVPRFDFEQEHGAGRLLGMPNYEVFYKPWVRQVVPGLAQSPALLGWQLGNELKARNTPRNGITPTQAYEWYLAFTRDIVDTIRELDRNHLIFMGAQYMAELVDWEYRPKDELAPDLVPEYRRLVTHALEACGRHCWNVWSLTNYDFNLYAYDDAALFAQAGVASMMIEYGFTRVSPAEMQRRFGGDRVAALRDGLGRPWPALDGTRHDRLWSAFEMVQRAPLAGIASWGSPAPGPDIGYDLDSERGITGAPEEAALWAAWANVAARLEAANRAAGPAAACLALRSPA